MSDKQFTGLSVHWGIRCTGNGEMPIQAEREREREWGSAHRLITANPWSSAIISPSSCCWYSVTCRPWLLQPKRKCKIQQISGWADTYAHDWISHEPNTRTKSIQRWGWDLKLETNWNVERTTEWVSRSIRRKASKRVDPHEGTAAFMMWRAECVHRGSAWASSSDPQLIEPNRTEPNRTELKRRTDSTANDGTWSMPACEFGSGQIDTTTPK